MPRLKINGTTLEYRDAGRGDAVVLVHGSASDRRAWDLQEGPLAERFRVISYSRRYHWPNDPIPDTADYSMKEHVADLEALLSALDAAPAHLVGHSYGAILCLLLAMRKPSLVRTLVLAEPPAITLFVSNTPKPLELLKVLATRPRTAAAIIRLGVMGAGPAKKAFRKGNTAAAVRTFGDAVFGAGGYDRLTESQRAQAGDNLSTIRGELLGSGFLPLGAGEVRKVHAPVLLVTGARSIRLFHHLADRLEELLPVTERVEVPESSHIMQNDNAREFNRSVVSFLERHGDAA